MSINCFIGVSGSIKSYASLIKNLDNDERDTIPTCNKETGSKRQLQKWIRGHLFIIRGDGHTDTWQPLYQ